MLEAKVRLIVGQMLKAMGMPTSHIEAAVSHLRAEVRADVSELRQRVDELSQSELLKSQRATLEGIDKDAKGLHSRLQMQILRNSVLTEVNYLVKIDPEIPRSTAWAVIQNMLEAVDFRDSWWAAHKNDTLDTWLCTFTSGFEEERLRAMSDTDPSHITTEDED